MRGVMYLLPYICMFAVFIYLMFSNNIQIVIIAGPVFIIGFAIYYLKALYDAFIVWKMDKEDGDQEAVLEYLGTYSKLPSNASRGSFSPGCISASFLIHRMFNHDKNNLAGEIVSLSGDIKNYDLVEGNKYKVTMRIHSKKLINIETFYE